MPTTTMKIREIKPVVVWNANDARNILIRIGAGLKKKAEQAHQDVGAVKCTHKGNDEIEFEWTGRTSFVVVQELIRY